MSLNTRKLMWLILASVAIAFGLSIRFRFIALDDSKHIWSNPYVTSLSWNNLEMFWHIPYYGLYVPVVYNVWALLAWASQTLGMTDPVTVFSAHLYHLTNVILHALNGLLFAGLLDQALRGRILETERRLWSVAAVFIFVLHPLQVESVVWASGLKDVLMGTFALLAWLFHQLTWPEEKAAKGKKGREEVYLDDKGFFHFLPRSDKAVSIYRILSPVCYVLSMLCKPGTVLFPAILIAFDMLVYGRSWKRSLSQVAWWLGAGAYIIWTTKSQQPDARLEFTILWWQKILLLPYSLGFYLSKVFYPFNLAPDYGLSPGVIMGKPPFWMYTAGGVVFLGLGVWSWFKARLLVVAWVAILAGLLPVSGWISFEYQNMSQVADRYMYLLPMIGLCWLAALGLKRLNFTRVPALVMTVAGILLLLTLLQTRHWRDNRTLFNQTLKVNPASYLAYNNLGLTALREGRLDEAVDLLKKSLEYKPDYSSAQSNLGAAYFRRKEFNLVVEHYDKVFASQPNLGLGSPAVYADMYYNYAAALLNSQRFDQGILALRKAVEINPDHFLAQFNLARALGEIKKDRVGAIEHYREALRLNPMAQEVRAELRKLGLSNP